MGQGCEQVKVPGSLGRMIASKSLSCIIGKFEPRIHKDREFALLYDANLKFILRGFVVESLFLFFNLVRLPRFYWSQSGVVAYTRYNY